MTARLPDNERRPHARIRRHRDHVGAAVRGDAGRGRHGDACERRQGLGQAISRRFEHTLGAVHDRDPELALNTSDEGKGLLVAVGVADRVDDHIDIRDRRLVGGHISADELDHVKLVAVDQRHEVDVAHVQVLAAFGVR